MTAELATITTSSSSNGLESKIRYAQALAGASLLPAQYRDRPANVLLAMELGEALGIPPIQAINGIHVIEGKPSASADLIASLVRRAGHKLRVTVDDQANTVTAQIIRADDPDFTYESVWTEGKARAAGLWGKGNWSKHPGQMLRSRAITEVCRMGASDALYGVIYTPEELGADTNAEGDVIVTQMPADTAPATKPPSLTEAVASHQAVHAPQEEQQPAQAEGDQPITRQQLTKLAALIKEHGLEKDEALGFYLSTTGREVATSKDLTKAEAHAVIEALESANEAGADPTTGEVQPEIVDAEVVEPTQQELSEYAPTGRQLADPWATQ